MQASEIC